MPRKRTTGATAAPASRRPRQLDEDHLRDLLAGARLRSRHCNRAELPALEAAIAELESEAAGRGIQLDAAVAEPTPPALARRRFLAAVAAGDTHAAVQAIRWLDPGELWLAYRRVRLQQQGFRIPCWLRLLHRLECYVLGRAAATERQDHLTKFELDAEEMEAYLLQCIDSMFAVILSGGALAGEGPCE